MAVVAKETGNSENLDFNEEKAFLGVVESRIDAIIERINNRIAPLERKLSDWRSYDYDDSDRKRIAMNDLKRYEQTRADVVVYKPNPYFCHFEMVLDGKGSREFCIGENQHDLRDDDGVLVLSRWSPLRNVYINKAQKHFELEVDGVKHTYDLRMRRMVKIEDAILVWANTEFDSADEAFDSDVADPFLVTVLRDKRRDYKLTNIVKTIQQNQNDILERPIGENFIVQGCAGSGKTMILLHRLSYLAFNHPEVDFSKYVVLTPNESFNRYIDELCEELDIGTIARMTVESYYVRLARRLSRNDVSVSRDKGGSIKQTPKISFSAENVVPEYSLPEDYLGEIYSERFAQKLEEHFYGAQEGVIEEIKDGVVGELFAGKGLSAPDVTSTPYEAYLEVTRACSKIKRDSTTLRDRAVAAKSARDEAADKLNEARRAYEFAIGLLEPARVAVIERAIPLYESKKSALDDLRSERSNATARRKSAREALSAATEELDKAEQSVSAAEAEFVSARQLASIDMDIEEAKSNSAVIEKAMQECSVEQAEITRLQSELGEIGLFGFGRRRAVREEIARAEQVLQEKYAESLQVAAEEHIAQVHAERAKSEEEAQSKLFEATQSAAAARETHAAAAEHLKRASEERDRLSQMVDQAKAEVEIMRKPIELFEDDKYPNLAAFEKNDALKAVSWELAEYAKKCTELSRVQARYLHLGENRLNSLSDKFEEAQEALEEIEEELASEVDDGVLAEAERLGSKLDATAFDAIFAREIDAIRSRFGVETTEGKSYRHDLYLKALECVLYYGPAADSGASICIDEAQDLSLAEHLLIRRAVGPDAAINLYGDTNQLVFPYKGIISWSDLPESIAANRYDLKENYRNTIQITNYCNERLNMDVMAIGLKGASVDRLSLNAAVNQLFALKGANSGIRCAVIYKRGLTGVKDVLNGLLGVDASYGHVDASKISVIPVDAVKGLEFDAVTVIDNGMSVNERYLSFTRALDNLMVTHVKGATVADLEELSEERGRTVGASELRAVDIRPTALETEPVEKSAEPEDDPFFDLDFS